MTGPKLSEEAFPSLADSMAEALHGNETVEELTELREGFLLPWKMALTQEWNLQKREIKKLGLVLKQSSNKRVRSLITAQIPPSTVRRTSQTKGRSG